jgi:hypothetical protein
MAGTIQTFDVTSCDGRFYLFRRGFETNVVYLGVQPVLTAFTILIPALLVLTIGWLLLGAALVRRPAIACRVLAVQSRVIYCPQPEFPRMRAVLFASCVPPRAPPTFPARRSRIVGSPPGRFLRDPL